MPDDSPVRIALAPISRDASTVCTRWLATVSSIDATPVMSITTTLARLVWIAPSSCSVRLRARRVQDADERQDQQAPADLQDGRRELADGGLLLADDPLSLLDEAHADRH